MKKYRFTQGGWYNIKAHVKVYNLSLIPIFSALTAAGALIRIPVPPVPITLQSFFVIMSGILLGPKAGAYSQIIYIIIGLIGLPVFSGGGGLSYVMKPTFGYLLGFICAAAVTGYIMRSRSFNTLTLFTASIFGVLTIYFIGTTYLALYLLTIMQKPDAIGIAIKTGFLIFIPGDIVKCIVLALILSRVDLLKKLRQR